MGAAREPVVITERGGMVVAERGPEILLIDRGNGPLEIVVFVLSVVTLVFGGFGAVVICTDVASGEALQSRTVGPTVLAVGVVAGAATLIAAGTVRQRRRRRLTTFTPIAVFDRGRRVFCDGHGRVVAPLDRVRFARRIQPMSSSLKLVAQTPAGDWVLKRGNPFGGGIGDLDRVLDRVVHDAPA